MHPNPVFRKTPVADAIQFAKTRGFGILSVNGLEGPLLSHIPFVFDDENHAVDLHLVRSNPIARLLSEKPVPAVIAVSGPDSYVSPDWYQTDDQVPTWNYVAVHLRGDLERLASDKLRSVLDKTSEHFENQLHPKTPWSADKMSDDTLHKMMRAIVPFRLRLRTVDGTWKLNQNKSRAARESAANHIESAQIGMQPEKLADLMRENNEST